MFGRTVVMVSLGLLLYIVETSVYSNIRVVG